MNNDMVSYYKKRAGEYEQIYLKPERQGELKELSDILQNIFAGREVFEIACGTGYWTEKISLTAKSVLASDINDTVLEIAKNKNYPNNNVIFTKQDLFTIKPGKKYDGLFGGFIWSHIPLQDLDDFLMKIKQSVVENGTIVFTDNNYAEGSSSPVTNKDESGNTYQTRKLNDGSSHLVLKNFPDEGFIIKKLDGIASEINFINLKYYWLLIYKNKS